MASIVKLGKGKQPPRAIDFTGLDGKRCRLRIGKVQVDEAKDFKRFVERLLNALRLSQTPDTETVRWLQGIDVTIRKRMARFGLCKQGKVTPTLSELISDFVEFKKLEIKPASVRRIEDSMALLKLYLGEETKISRITPGTAKEWRTKLLKTGLSEATIRTHTRNAKTLFNDAVEREIVRKNPFSKLPSTSVAAKKGRYITPDETQQIIDACPDWKWRTFVGLLRYIGLRCPSETHSVNWSDVDWERGILTIRATKTNSVRQAPIRPELMMLLKEAFADKKKHAKAIIDIKTNNRYRTFKKILKRANVEPWEDIFQHLRRCCRTQFLNEGHPPHAVSRWMGHGQLVGDEHYTMLTDDVFDKVTGIVPDSGSSKSAARSAESAAADHCIGLQPAANGKLSFDDSAQKNLVFVGNNDKNEVKFEVRAQGLEPWTYGLKVRCSTN